MVFPKPERNNLFMYKKQSDIYKNHVASVLEFIYRAGQTSRIEIANNTGLTPALMKSAAFPVPDASVNFLHSTHPPVIYLASKSI